MELVTTGTQDKQAVTLYSRNRMERFENFLKRFFGKKKYFVFLTSSLAVSLVQFCHLYMAAVLIYSACTFKQGILFCRKGAVGRGWDGA